MKDMREELKADIFIYVGFLSRPYDEIFINLCNKENKKHKKACLLLATFGGDAAAAYRISRQLKRVYDCYSVYIHTICKSAGTIVAIGATEIIMSELGELGPLDVQLQKTDELGERSSGLTITDSLETLKNRAFKMFENYFLNLRFRSGQQISTKSAMEAATNLTVGLYGPIFSQIDPLRLGENQRAIRIALHYCEMLKTENIKDDAIPVLISGYPDHGFVIDDEEAKKIFSNVRKPTHKELSLAKYIISHPKFEDCLNKNDETLILHSSGVCDSELTNDQGGKNGQTAVEGCAKPSRAIDRGEEGSSRSIVEGTKTATRNTGQSEETAAGKHRKSEKALARKPLVTNNSK